MSEDRKGRDLQADPLPNRRYDHAFAIVRVDAAAGAEAPGEDSITVQKVVWDQGFAEAEVARLNSLNAEEWPKYFWQLTRVERGRPQAARADWRVKRIWKS
jgi:hypothetical protein